MNFWIVFTMGALFGSTLATITMWYKYVDKTSSEQRTQGAKNEV